MDELDFNSSESFNFEPESYEDWEALEDEREAVAEFFM